MPVLKVLFFADIFGKMGRLGTKKILPRLKKTYQPDIIIANAENIAHGRGLTLSTITELQEAGIDFFTSGNHVWDKPNSDKILDNPDIPLIRPANYLKKLAGQGQKILKIRQNNLLVINLIGRVFFKEQDDFGCPFLEATQIIKQYSSENLAGILIDFHAEATSEKRALGHYLDGKVSAVIGTHTHVQTADDQILDNGTAYISDAGMTGPQDSVIGLNKETIINNFISGQTKSAEVPDKGACLINAVYLEINPETKMAEKITRINKQINI